VITVASGENRIKGAYAIDETLSRLKGYYHQRYQVLQRDRPVRSRVRCWHQPRPSTLLVFGNLPFGTQFLTADPDAGLDWPVRQPVFEDE
jgi:hypothetical protein